MSILREPEKPVRKDDKFSGFCRIRSCSRLGKGMGVSALSFSFQEEKKESFVSVSPLRADMMDGVHVAPDTIGRAAVDLAVGHQTTVR